MVVDHLIYGTLPDTPGSQHVIAKSPTVSSRLETWLINYYDQFGDCRNEGFSKSLSVCWYREEPDADRAIVTLISHHGKDFSGRWGALLRHSAILAPEQYDLLGCLPDLVEGQLLSTGTSEELAAIERLDLGATEQDPGFLSELVLSEDSSFEQCRGDLQALLRGQRLVLYAESNTDHSNQYVRRLIALLPVKCRRNLNWSEFVFRTSESLDISLVYSARHEAVREGRLAFTAIGDNHIRGLNLPPDFVDSYLGRLAGVMASKDAQQLASLFLEA
jgi:hypothetical protein